LEVVVLYHLPDQAPALTLVAPSDAGFWAALGVHAADRHAVVIGDVADPARSTVIVGTRPDIAEYLDPFHGALTSRLTQLGAKTRRGPAPHDTVPRHEQQPQPDAAPPPGGPLIALPHSGLRIPDRRLHISHYQDLPMADGVAFTAVLRLDGHTVGTIANSGAGGATTYTPIAGSALRHCDLQKYAARCRSAAGRGVLDEELLDALVTELQTGQVIASAARAGHSVLRRMAPLDAGEHLGVELRTVPAVTTTTGRAAVARTAAQTWPADDGQWWQLWTGQRWEDLTPRPVENPTAQEEATSQEATPDGPTPPTATGRRRRV
jgi:hypothetical protein